MVSAITSKGNDRTTSIYAIYLRIILFITENATLELMAAADKNSLSASRQTSTPVQPHKLSDYDHLNIPTAAKPSRIQPLSIKVDDAPGGTAPGFLHLPSPRSETNPSFPVAAILLSGAGGGVVGPSSMYLGLADKLSSLAPPIPTLRLDYRFPARNKYCVHDVQAAMAYLETQYAINRFILVGWSFGGAPVFTLAGMDQRVRACATVASQTAEIEGIKSVSPRPVLLLHGTGDERLSPLCSERLYQWYGPGGNRRLELFENDDHSLTRNAQRVEKMLGEFVVECAGLDILDAQKDVLAEEVISTDRRVALMYEGGDLRGEESIK